VAKEVANAHVTRSPARIQNRCDSDLGCHLRWFGLAVTASPAEPVQIRWKFFGVRRSIKRLLVSNVGEAEPCLGSLHAAVCGQFLGAKWREGCSVSVFRSGHCPGNGRNFAIAEIISAPRLMKFRPVRRSRNQQHHCLRLRRSVEPHQLHRSGKWRDR